MCGQGQDIEGNDNGKIEFGEWYRDDVELSVVKLINGVSSSTARLSKNTPQYADGDDNQYRANVTVFTSTVASILLQAADERNIDATAISDASTKVIESLIGDTALAASLTGDISLGGAVDLTDVDAGDTLDAGSLTLSQVAASIQAVATKSSKSIDEVLSEINAGIESGTLEQSEAYNEVKKEAKTAGTILEAAISGDEEELKAVLIEAGISEEDVSEVANKVIESKDEAIENSGTDEDDLKKDIEDAKDKLDNLGNNENETENNVLLEDLGVVSDVLTGASSSQSQLIQKLDEVKNLSDGINTRAKAIEYFAAAQNLRENVLVQIVNGTNDTESLTAILAAQNAVLAALKERATTLVSKDSQFQSTLDLVNTLLDQISSFNVVNETLSTESLTQLNNATSLVEQFASILDALEEAANLAISELTSSQSEFDDKKESYISFSDAASQAELSIKGIDSANEAINKIEDAIEKLNELSPLAVNFVQLASSASSSAAAFSAEAVSQNAKVDEANALTKQVVALDSLANEAISYTNTQNELLENLLTSANGKKKQYEDEEAIRNAENTVLVEKIAASEVQLDFVRTSISELITSLSELDSMLPTDKKFTNNDDATAFYGKAINLQKAYETKVINGTESTQSTSAILNEQSVLLAQYKTSAENLVAANDVYAPTLERVQANIESLENIKESQSELFESITEHVALAEEAVEEFILQAKQVAFEEAKSNLESKKSDYQTVSANLENLIQEANIALADISSLDTASAAIGAYELAIDFLNETVQPVLTNYIQLAAITKEAADDYRAEADKQQNNVADAAAAQSAAAINFTIANDAQEKQTSDLKALEGNLETALEQQKKYQTQKDNSELNEQIKTLIDDLNNKTSDDLSRVATLKSELDSVIAKGINADTEAKVTDYFNAAFALSSDFTVEEKDNLLASAQNYLNQAEGLLASATSLANQNSEYVDTKEAAQSLVGVLEGQIESLVAVYDSIQTELAKATKKAEEFDIEVQVAKDAAEKAYLDTVAAKAEFEASKTAFEEAYELAIATFNEIDNSSSSAQKAIDALVSAQEKFESYLESVTSFEAKANTALLAVNAYLDILGNNSNNSFSVNVSNSDGPELSPEELLVEVNRLLETSSTALDVANADERDEEIRGLETKSEELKQELSDNEFTSDIAREGTSKVVTASFVTKEGSSAIYDVGDVIFDVVKNIIDEGRFELGEQQGCSIKYPEWCYSYNVDTDENDLSFTFSNSNDGQRLDLEGFLRTSKVRSQIIMTWSGNLLTDSGQKIVVAAPSLAECESYAIGLQPTPNASCAVLEFDREVVNVEDAEDAHIHRLYSYNVVELVDGQYGFDGIVSFDIIGLDKDGNPAGLFTSGDVIEHADFVVEGWTEQTQFNTTFDVKYEDIHQEIGTSKVSLLNFNGYEFKVDLVSEVGPLEGEVSLYNGIEGKERVSAGTIREITNGFKVIYIDGLSIDYTEIEFLGKSN